MLALAVAAGAALLVGRPWQNGGGPADAAPAPSRTAPEAGPDNASEPLEDAPEPTPPPTPTPSATKEAEEETDGLKAEDIPASGPGTFTVARAGVTPKGKGSAYRVEVEDGIGVDPDRAAHAASPPCSPIRAAGATAASARSARSPTVRPGW